MGFNVKTAIVRLIERTNNPFAPVILQETHNNANRLADMLRPEADQAKAEAYLERLLAHFEDDEEFSSDPAFILCVCGMLMEAIVTYTVETEKRNGR